MWKSWRNFIKSSIPDTHFARVCIRNGWLYRICYLKPLSHSLIILSMIEIYLLDLLHTHLDCFYSVFLTWEFQCQKHTIETIYLYSKLLRGWEEVLHRFPNQKHTILLTSIRKSVHSFMVGGCHWIWMYAKLSTVLQYSESHADITQKCYLYKHCVSIQFFLCLSNFLITHVTQFSTRW